MRARSLRALLVAGALAIAWSTTTTALADDNPPPGAQDFGPSVHIFSPSMDQAAIQAELNAISVAQVHNEFGSRADAILFQPRNSGPGPHPPHLQDGLTN